MRLAMIAVNGTPRAVAWTREGFVDLQATDGGLPASVRQILDGGPSLLHAAAQAGRRPNAVRHAAGQVKLLAPILDPPKIICLGLNYKDHAAESGSPIPKKPSLF